VTAHPEAEGTGELFTSVVGQDRALGQLRAALVRPVHAYLFLGPPGSSTESAALGFAAGLVCPLGGCGTCDSCARALRGVHPDVTWFRRTGAALSVEEIRDVTTRALRRPVEGVRQVLVVDDVHLAVRSAPALLKTLEEPPATTVFVLLAEDLPPGLATVASRCAVVSFASLGEADVADWLIRRGVEPLRARLVAAGAAGDLERAALLADDEDYQARLARWREVPLQLDGSGASAAATADELLATLDTALEPLRRHHEREVTELEEEARQRGERGLPGRRELQERQQRAERRWRTDELRSGLAVLQRAYRDRLRAVLEQLEDEPTSPRLLDEAARDAAAVERITKASAALTRNVQPPLLVAALLAELAST
jgi:DNA polymerase III subunit delta'